MSQKPWFEPDASDDVSDDEIELHRLALTHFDTKRPKMAEVLRYSDKHNLNDRAQKPRNRRSK